jgi:hypothetical protein
MRALAVRRLALLKCIRASTVKEVDRNTMAFASVGGLQGAVEVRDKVDFRPVVRRVT